MVIVRLTGGLGNQLFQYALGRTLALRHGVPLALDLAAYTPANPRVYELGDLAIAALTATAVQVAQIRGGGLARVADRLRPLHRRRWIRDARRSFDPRVLRAGPRVYLQGFWQSPRYFETAEGVLRRELVLRRPAGRTAELAGAAGAANSVSVHVRRGDYATDPGARRVHGLCPPAYYEEALALVASRHGTQHVFVFSDDVDWVRAHVRLPEPVTWVSGMGLSPAQELAVMSACRHHVISNSTFGWWGAWLDPRPAALVVAPRRWFADPTRTAGDLLSPAWVRL